MKNTLRFRYYGDFHEINYIYKDCMDHLVYKYNDRIDGSPIFHYYCDLKDDIIDDVNKLSVFLRELKVRKIVKNDLTEDELSIYTFFKFYIKCKKEGLLVRLKNYY